MWEVLLPLISFWMSFRVTPKKIDALLSEKSGAAQNNAEFAAPEAVRAAAVQLTARAYKDLRDYMDEVYLLAKNAVDAGAQVVVYPEYAGVLALTMLPLSKQILNWVLRGSHFIGLDGAAPDPVRMETVLDTFGGFLNELYQTANRPASRIRQARSGSTTTPAFRPPMSSSRSTRRSARSALSSGRTLITLNASKSSRRKARA